MDWYETIFELIDMRSFSNLWFWIAVSVMWSTASHYVVGVPHDLIRRAEREGGQAMADMRSLADIHARRTLFILRQGGLVIVAFLSFLMAGLLALAMGYGVEFAQAVLCLLVPMMVIYGLNIRTCLWIETGEVPDAEMIRRLRRHRMTLQAVGMIALFFTAMFGMYKNMTVGVLG